MTADEIRHKYADGRVNEFQREIAAQLAELNGHMKIITTLIASVIVTPEVK